MHLPSIRWPDEVPSICSNTHDGHHVLSITISLLVLRTLFFATHHPLPFTIQRICPYFIYSIGVLISNRLFCFHHLHQVKPGFDSVLIDCLTPLSLKTCCPGHLDSVQMLFNKPVCPIPPLVEILANFSGVILAFRISLTCSCSLQWLKGKPWLPHSIIYSRTTLVLPSDNQDLVALASALVWPPLAPHISCIWSIGISLPVSIL